MSDTNISDDAVREATGRGWQGWFELLDAWGAPGKGHKASAKHLADEHGLSGWWSQMVTVQYERERGLRELGETSSGYQMGAQKTFLPDAAAAWELIASGKGLAVLLGDGAPASVGEGDRFELQDGTQVEVRVVQEGSHLRLGWQPPGWEAPSTLQIRANEASSGRGTVSVHHEGLPSGAAREAMKAHWKLRLAKLAEASRS